MELNHNIQTLLPVEIKERKSWFLLQRKTYKNKSVCIRIFNVADIFGDASTYTEIKDKMAH